MRDAHCSLTCTPQYSIATRHNLLTIHFWWALSGFHQSIIPRIHHTFIIQQSSNCAFQCDTTTSGEMNGPHTESSNGCPCDVYRRFYENFAGNIFQEPYGVAQPARARHVHLGIGHIAKGRACAPGLPWRAPSPPAAPRTTIYARCCSRRPHAPAPPAPQPLLAPLSHSRPL